MRTVLTEEKDTALYPIASLESAQLSNEKLYYFGEDSGRINKSSVSGYPTDNTTSPNDYIQQLSGSGYKIGTGIVLKVMAGDQVLIKATSWYNKNGVTPGTPSSPLNALISALISGVGGVTNAAHGITPTQLQNSGVLIPGATAFYGSHNSADSTTKPKAFLNWILLDDQFRYVASGSGFDQVGSDQQLKTHYVTPTMAKNGFLYVYVSNETPNINVYFDNLTVTHIKSPLLQEQSYYPFGLQMAGISDKALGKLDSKNKFDGGVEFEEDYGVNLYTTFYRGYDPQIGRFNGVDILSEKTFSMSVYGFCLNNPVIFNDPNGDDAAQSKGDSPDWLYQIVYDLWMSTGDDTGNWGATWSSNGGGGGSGTTTYYKTEAAAFEAGGEYLDKTGAWGTNGFATSFEDAQSAYKRIAGDKFDPGVMALAPTAYINGFSQNDLASLDKQIARNAGMTLNDFNIGSPFSMSGASLYSPGAQSTQNFWGNTFKAAGSVVIAGGGPEDPAADVVAAGVVVVAGVIYLFENAGKGNPNYPGPWSYSYRPSSEDPINWNMNNYDNNKFPDWGGALKWISAGAAIYDIYKHFMDQVNNNFGPSLGPVVPIHNPYYVPQNP